MTPNEFIEKWRGGGDERRDAQSFFDDLCRLAGHRTPREADPDHTWFTYEYGVGKAAGGRGFADAWKKGYFGWEAKGTGRSLQDAYAQLKMYSDDLQNPPLLVVSDLRTIEIHTNFTNTVKEVHRFTVEDLADPAVLRKVRAMFNNPDELKPDTKRSDITAEAARKFADLAWALRQRGHEAHAVAHFLNRLVFCMFAEDIGLLPDNLFTRLVEGSQDDPDAFVDNARQLFAAMHAKGGRVAFVPIAWFNGGLFDNDTALRLDRDELRSLLAACRLSWDQIDPSIFGTLFERGLDPAKRKQLGANYTDPATITKLIRPVIIEPWLSDWDAEKAILGPLLEKADIKGSRQGLSSAQKAAQTRAFGEAQERYIQFLGRLHAFTVLDPACGSGNFLFMALRALKDIERRVMLEAEELGLPRQILGVSPRQVFGIEVNAYAAELARITVWIGELQWMIQNGYGARMDPILLPLDQIQCRDALLEGEVPAAWPVCDVIVGNPPFIGNKKLRRELGDEYVERLRSAYDGHVSEGADFVCYWFERSMDCLPAGTARVGLVSTNSIRGGANRRSLERVGDQSRIFEAWSDQEWWDRGTAVRVSMVAFGQSQAQPHLDGRPVEVIYPDLTGPAVGVEGVNLTLAKRLDTNRGRSFQGSVKVGKFDIPESTALAWMGQPNAVGGENYEVLRPLFNTRDLTTRPRGKWIVDFNARSEREAAGYALPFAHVVENVRPKRLKNKDEGRRTKWWLHGRVGTEIRAAVAPLERVIITPRVSKHRVFVWGHPRAYYDDATVSIAREDDTSMGILHSRIHEVWALRMGTWMGVGNDPRYTPGTTFETFPFPEGLTPDIPAPDYADDPRAQRIATASAALLNARERWLNPPEWIEYQQTDKEAEAGLPRRIVPRPPFTAQWRQRTLTKLYNDNEQWLVDLHADLDRAVAAAYGWEWPLEEDEILRRLYALNVEQRGGTVVAEPEEEEEEDDD